MKMLTPPPGVHLRMLLLGISEEKISIRYPHRPLRPRKAGGYFFENRLRGNNLIESRIKTLDRWRLLVSRRDNVVFGCVGLLCRFLRTAGQERCNRNRVENAPRKGSSCHHVCLLLNAVTLNEKNVSRIEQA